MTTDAQVVIDRALAAHAAGQHVLLVTVAKTWGSSPRPPGSMLAIIAPQSARPVLIGSVSGGCVEDDLRERLSRAPQPNRPQLIRYGGAESERVGLPCGGELLLVIESLTATDQLAPARAALNCRASMSRVLDLRTGAVQWHTGLRPVQLTDETFICPFGPAWRLLLIGAGPVAGHLARMALALDFAVTLCDGRPERLPSWQQQFPDLIDAVTLDARSPDRVAETLPIDTRTAVVALAHDPRQDDLGLMVALEQPAFYIAAMGSLRTSAARRERLQSLGIDTQRLMAPAGLDIGSHTPAEIAVSIAAELVAAKQTVGQANQQAAALQATTEVLAEARAEALAEPVEDLVSTRMHIRHDPPSTNT
ncbi:XdhC family protein [Halothiobacillus sp.]|uniref:XdhC family protein n=1 Tax=Halothiobacillus sp. TaxID=1891311 RepID=UPI002AD2D359|nr:XdhC family protein [Halothiobacillus sp.]